MTPKLTGGWKIHSVCKIGDAGTVTSDGDVTGDADLSPPPELWLLAA